MCINKVIMSRKLTQTRRYIRVYFKSSFRALWRSQESKAKVSWKKFQSKVESLFALSEHSILRAPRVILRMTLAVIITLFLWASFFHIDQVVNVQGQVIANSRSQIVQAADTGILVDMRVEEGDSVERGQIIATLEKERATAAYTESHGKVAALTMTVKRLQAEIAEKDLTFDPFLASQYPDLVETQLNLFNQRRNGFLRQTRVLKDNIKLAEEELKMNLPLEKMGDVSKTDILRLRKAVNEANGNFITQRNKYFQDASAELNKAEEDLNTQEQTLLDRRQILEHTDIIAPATGVIKSIRVTTLGGVVRQGDEILQILPTESALIIEAKLKPAEMGFMKVGLPAKVKLDAYDYSVFGVMKGDVSYISPDTLTEDTKLGIVTYYRVKVNIGEREFKGRIASDIEVRPGMTATVDIKTGSRTILAYLLKPVSKTIEQSMGEK